MILQLRFMISGFKIKIGYLPCFGVSWVCPSSAKDTLIGWNGSIERGTNGFGW